MRGKKRMKTMQSCKYVNVLSFIHTQAYKLDAEVTHNVAEKCLRIKKGGEISNCARRATDT